MKKLFLLIVLLLFSSQVFAKDIPVKIYAPKKISTSNINLQDGDYVEFKTLSDVVLNSNLYIKKDELVLGLITDMHDNQFGSKEASVYIENFTVKNTEGKIINLGGFIYKKGNNHWMLTQILPGLPLFFRGGEVQINPNDTFDLYIKE